MEGRRRRRLPWLVVVLVVLCYLTGTAEAAKKGSGKKKRDKKAKDANGSKGAKSGSGNDLVGRVGPPDSLRANTEKTVPLRTHSLYAPYVDSDLQNRWFDFGGDTIINTNKHVRLTQDRPSQSGWLWSRLAIAPNQFEVEFEFRVDGKSNSLFGDGFAVWLTKARAQAGPVFGNMDRWEGMGIFFDTYANSRHPYSFPRIYAIMNDGSKAYDSARDGQAQEIGACSLDFRRTDIAAKARITYFRGRFFELAIHHDRWDEWTPCIVVEKLDLPTNPFLGFTAHTGDVSDNHDIVSITTSNIAYHPPAGDVAPTKKSRRSVPGSGFFSWLFGLLKWVLLISGIAYAVVVYRGRNARKKMRRF